MGCLPMARFHRDCIGRTDRNAGAASRTGMRIELGNERPAEPRPEPDGAFRTAVAAGLTVDVIIGEAPVIDNCMMGKAAGGTCRKNALGTSFRALAAEGAFPEPEIHGGNARTDRNDLGGTGIDAWRRSRAHCLRCGRS